jgi:hypothetical protein
VSKRRRGNGDRFLCLHHWMLKSPAWRALSPNAKAVLLHLWERHNGSNNGQIVYGVRDAAEIRISKDQAARALIELINRGFLRVTRAAAFTFKTKEARCWAITAEPIDDQPPTKDFARWSPTQKHFSRLTRETVQSHPRDREAKNGLENGLSVSPVRPSTAELAGPRSHPRDTSNIPGSTPFEAPLEAEQSPAKSIWPKTRRIPRFGDNAKAERTARNPKWLH